MSVETEILNGIKEDIKEIKENLQKIYTEINVTDKLTIVNSEKVKNLEEKIIEIKKDREQIIRDAKQKVMIWVYGLIVATGGSIIAFLVNLIFK